MSMLLMAKVFGMKFGNSTRKLVLLKLADNANDKGECFPSYQHIADHCEISRRSAINHINALCEQGFVKKVSRKGDKGNSSNIFILNLNGEKSALYGENNSPYSENDSLPPSENPAPITSHSFESVIESKKLNKKDSFDPICVKPKNLSIKAWSKWVEYRKEKGKKLTETSWRKHIELLESQNNPEAIIDKSILSGWIGLFPEKHGGKKSTPIVQPKQSGMTPERQREYDQYLFMNGLT